MYLFIYLFIHFVSECQHSCFKNSWYTFSKWGRNWRKNRMACKYQGGYLVSIETEEKWQFINQEIKKRSSWNTTGWHIGLKKNATTWTWESGAQLNISKWRLKDKKTKGRGEYPRMKAFFTQFLGPKSTPLFVKCPKVNRNSTDKDHYMLEHALLELIWWEFIWKIYFP